MKLQDFLDSGYLSRDHIFYKLIKNAVDFVTSVNNGFSSDDQFQWDSDILQFLDTIEYYGHEATVNLLRGSGFYNRAVDKNKSTIQTPRFDWKTWNWPLPGRTTRQKRNKGRYTTEDGVYWPLIENFLAIISDEKSGLEPIFYDKKTKLKLFAVTSQEDGMALKPGLRVDSHQGKVIGASIPIGLQYTRNNSPPKTEELKKAMVKEAHCTCIETLDGKFAIPVGVHYLPTAVTGNEQLEQSLESIGCLETCLSCIRNSKMCFSGSVLKGKGHCKSACAECISLQDVCQACQEVGHKFINPALRACDECLNKGEDCIKLVCLAWIMDSESKNKNSQTSLNQNQKDNEDGDETDSTDLLTAFPDAVHVAKNDRASFANWYRLVDGYRVNLVLLRTARADLNMKNLLMPHLSLAACRNRDRMDVDTVIEICTPEVRQGLLNTTFIVQTLIPEVYRIYDANKDGVLRSPVSICPASWGTILISDKDRGKIFSARLHYPVDVTEVVTGLNNPVGIAYNEGLLLIAELGKNQIVCYDLTGDYFLNPEKMTVKQLRKALNDRKLLEKGDKSKKEELQKKLRTWMDENRTSTQNVESDSSSSKLYPVSVYNKPSIKPTAIVFSSSNSSHVCVAEISGEVHLMAVKTDGQKATAEIISSVTVGVNSVFGVACSNSASDCYVSSSADDGGLFLVNFETSSSRCVLSNGGVSLKRIHGIWLKSDRTIVMADREANKVKEFDTVSKQVTTVAGSGLRESRDGCPSTASFAQPTGICCEKDTSSVFVVDSSSGRVRLVTSAKALVKYLQNLWLFLSAFNLTSSENASFEETINHVQHYYAFHEEASMKVQSIKGSTCATQGPDGTLSSATLRSVKMILEGLNRLKTKVLEINPAFMQHVNVGSLLTLFVENFFSSMRGGNTDTPMMLDFCMRFPRCFNELLKRVTGTSYMYFTSPVASYYLQPTLGNVAISFGDLEKLPKPLSGCLSKKQLTELRQWVLQYGKSVRQNTTRNHSTKDKPGTLPLNLYAPLPPEQHLVDFDELLREDLLPQQSASSTRNITIPQSTFVVVSRKYRPSSVPTSPLYITKLLEDVVDDNEETCYVKMIWYTQDFVDPLLFNDTGEEVAIPKEAIKGIVNNVRVTFEETLEIDEDEYYLLLALLNGSADSESLNEAEGQLVEEVAEGQEESMDDTSSTRISRPQRKRKKTSKNVFLFY